MPHPASSSSSGPDGPGECSRRWPPETTPALVNRLRNGPPRWSPFRLRRVGEAGNGIEFFVHHEDARRAQPGWRPRELTPDVDQLVWSRTRRMAGIVLRKMPAGVELVRTGTGERHMARAAKAGQPVMTLSGSASELLLYLYGRRTPRTKATRRTDPPRKETSTNGIGGRSWSFRIGLRHVTRGSVLRAENAKRRRHMVALDHQRAAPAKATTRHALVEREGDTDALDAVDKA